MGNVTSWIAQCIYPEEQVFWQAARSGDTHMLRQAVAKLTPETRKRIEWQEPCSGHTALAQAAYCGYVECAKILVEAGANCNAKDYRGNTPLHLACKSGNVAVVQYLLTVPQVFPFETNVAMMTPLDVARDKYTKHEDHTVRYAECIEVLEKKFCIYSGWLYEKTDNVLSMVSGISSLNSWTKRFCIVLERGAPDILELALFRLPPGSIRPACPSSVVLYHVAAGMTETTDTKWFNRKEHAFKINGNLKDKCHYDATIVMKPLEFAAVDQAGFKAWKSFFDYHQQTLAIQPQPNPYAVYNQPTIPTTQQGSMESMSTYPSANSNLSLPNLSTAGPAANTTNVRRSVPDDEDEDLRRAIQLSLQTAEIECHGAHEAIRSPPLPVSAPDWEDDGSSFSPSNATGSSGEDAGSSLTSTSINSPTKAVGSPVVNYGRAPSYSSIGECVVCFDGPQAAVCVPCGHNAVCMHCAEEILDTTCECPVCRSPIRELIKLYRV